jgi:hypothetical protein
LTFFIFSLFLSFFLSFFLFIVTVRLTLDFRLDTHASAVNSDSDLPLCCPRGLIGWTRGVSHQQPKHLCALVLSQEPHHTQIGLVVFLLAFSSPSLRLLLSLPWPLLASLDFVYNHHHTTICVAEWLQETRPNNVDPRSCDDQPIPCVLPLITCILLQY